MLKYNENGWLFNSKYLNNIIHIITNEEIFDLFELQKEEDNWIKSVNIEDNISKIKSAGDFFVDFIRKQNIAGTIISSPFGQYISFNSTRHLYRGENRLWEKSIPSLNREFNNNTKDNELCRIIENLRIIQFSDLLWQINTVPYWEAKISDVNYKALAQHYGFKTHLLDLTNDFRDALFFATCKYIPETDTYLPLSNDDIKNKGYEYGMLFHSPDWCIDYIQPTKSIEVTSKIIEMKKSINIDSGYCDQIAFQIGYQPLFRCHYQSGYMYPNRNGLPLQQDTSFEKIVFKQSEELSNYVYELMHKGKKVMPVEGINNINDIISKIKQNKKFSYKQVEELFNNEEIDKKIFPTIDSLINELSKNEIEIVNNDVKFIIPKQKLEVINKFYNNIDVIELCGGEIRYTPEQKEYRKQKCIDIYSKVI